MLLSFEVDINLGSFLNAQSDKNDSVANAGDTFGPYC